MLNLVMLEKLPRPNWALTPWLGNPPTISEYKKRSYQYQNDIIPNGVYQITASNNAVNARYDDLWLENDPEYWAWRNSDQEGRMPCKRDSSIKIYTSNYIWVESIARGTISVTDKVYTFVGVFEKNGSVIGFNTLHPEAFKHV